MAEITNKLIEQAFEIGKQIFRKEIPLKVGIESLVRQGMNQSSAHDYVYSYSNLIQGKLFTRTTNTYGTEYYLEKIYQEEGTVGLENALLSLSQHIDYYEELTGSAVKKRKEIYNKYLELLNIDKDEVKYPDDLSPDEEYSEGKSKLILVNSYERNPVARKKCIEYHGLTCQVCKLNFEKVYGEIGREFIHIHHKVELSTIGKEYSVNPITDLVPVCPNCHAMLHKKKPAYTIEELKEILTANIV